MTESPAPESAAERSLIDFPLLPVTRVSLQVFFCRLFMNSILPPPALPGEKRHDIRDTGPDHSEQMATEADAPNLSAPAIMISASCGYGCLQMPLPRACTLLPSSEKHNVLCRCSSGEKPVDVFTKSAPAFSAGNIRDFLFPAEEARLKSDLHERLLLNSLNDCPNIRENVVLITSQKSADRNDHIHFLRSLPHGRGASKAFAH